MLLLVSAVLLIAVTVLFTLSVRAADYRESETVSPTQHLEDRRAAIYENLRDLQFEYRVGKLSDEDYQQTKLGLQKELAGVLAEMERITGDAPAPVADPVADDVEMGEVEEAEDEAPAAVAASEAGAEAVPETVEAADASAETSADAEGVTCPHCGAHFPSAMKFCGSCGKEIVQNASQGGAA